MKIERFEDIQEDFNKIYNQAEIVSKKDSGFIKYIDSQLKQTKQPMHLHIINPLEYTGWDDLLLAGGDKSFFHTSAWARVLVESYNYKPLYFTQITDGMVTLLFPFMEIESIITGKRVVSLPFTDFCSPMASDKETFKDAMEQIIAHGRNSGWKHIDLRGGGEHMVGVTPSLTHYTHDLTINKDEKEIFNNFKDNTRRNIKKAIKEGVEITLDNSFESIKNFFQLNCVTRKRHGLPPQPLRFFKKIYEYIILEKKGFVSLASYKKKIIAGAVFFHFGKNVIFKYAAFDINYSYLRPNNLLLWESIRSCLNNGFVNLNFGTTDLDDKGLLQFKRTWGVKEDILNYYRYDIVKEAFVKDEFRAKTSYPLFRNMPSSLLNLTGSLIYRHFG